MKCELIVISTAAGKINHDVDGGGENLLLLLLLLPF